MLTALTPQSVIVIGDHTAMSGVSIVTQNAITISKGVQVGAGACTWDTDFHPLDFYQRRIHVGRGAHTVPVHVDDDVFIGSRSIILKGVHIGRGSVVRAGSVVTKDVIPGMIVAGNPARAIGSIS